MANPDLHLTDAFPLWTIPADTVRMLTAQPGLVSDITYRPAPSTEIRRTYTQLSRTERRAVHALLHTPATLESSALSSLSSDQLTLALEQAIAYLQYQQAREQKQEIVSKQDHLHPLLLARSQLGSQSPTVTIEPFTTQPDIGHRSLRAGLGLGWRQKDWFEELTVRAGYHDLLDPAPGYTPDAQIEILAVALRHYHQQNRIRLDRFTLVDAVSLSPVEPLFFAPSWKGRVGLHTVSRDGCRYCQNFTLSGSIGLAAQTQWLRREVYFLFPEVDANVSRAFTPAYRVGVGSTAGVLFHLTDRWKMLASGTYLRYPVGDTGKKIRGFFAQQYAFHKNWALRFEFRHEHQDNETTLLLYAYF